MTCELCVDNITLLPPISGSIHVKHYGYQTEKNEPNSSLRLGLMQKVIK